MASPLRSIKQVEPAMTPAVFKGVDSDEASGKRAAGVGAFFTRIVSRKKQEKAFDAAHKLANLTQKTREKYIKDSLLTHHEEVQDLKKSIDQESAERLKRQEAVLAESQSVRRVVVKKFLDASEEQSNAAMYYLNVGFDIARQVLSAGKKVETFFDIKKTSEFLEAWKSLEDKLKQTEAGKKNIAAVKEEFSFFVSLGLECVNLDIAISNMSALKQKMSEKKAELNKATRDKDKEALKIELNRLRYQEKELKKKIDTMKSALKLSGLNTLVSKGVKYADAVSSLIKTSSTARVILGNMTKHLAFIGSLINFTTVVNGLIKLGKKIHKTNKTIASLKEEQNKIADLNLNTLTKMLLNNAINFKIMHLEKSKVRLKTEAAFAMLRAVVASIQVSQATIACLAILCGIVIATPGLNTTAIVLGILIAVGIKGVEIFTKIKHDRKGMKLDLQKTEESHKIFALSGRFHTKAAEFQQLQMEIRKLAQDERDILMKVKKLHDEKDQHHPKTFEASELYYLFQLKPIIDRRIEIQNRYDDVHNELYMMSLELDALIANKNVLESHRTMETAAQEFNIQKSDLLVMADVFKETLKSPEVKEELIRFLTDKGIAITSEDDIFASVLRFIRNDDEMLGKGLEEEVEE